MTGVLLVAGTAYPLRAPWFLFLVFFIGFCFVCLRLVSCMPNAVSVSELSILDRTFGFLWRFIVKSPIYIINANDLDI